MDIANRIKDYLDELNIREDTISVEILEKALRKVIGKQIKIKVNWDKDFKMNETTGEVTEPVEKIRDIELWWYDENPSGDPDALFVPRFIKYNLKNNEA